ncbi:MAG TPA: hypothetical protein VJ302_05785 [Blastocatellia bacterium]|nr:hypothetical protein [Blastocatellia bacterium]
MMLEQVEDGGRSVAGLSVSMERVIACRRRVVGDGEADSEVQGFAMLPQLEPLANWLSEWQVTEVAMETREVSWLPVINELHGKFELLLVEPRHFHFKEMFSGEGETAEAEWIARLLQNDLLKGDFVTRAPKAGVGMLWIPVWRPSDRKSAGNDQPPPPAARA